MNHGGLGEKALFCKTVYDDAMRLAELHNLCGLKSSGQIEIFECRLVKKIKNEADVPGISCVIQVLHFSNCLFCQSHSLSMDCRPRPWHSLME